MSNQRLIAGAARWTRWFVIAVLVVSVAFQLAAQFPGVSHVRVHPAGSGPFGPWLGALHLVLMVLALIQLIQLLRRLEAGDLFSAAVTRKLRAFALFALLAVAVGGVLAPLLAWLMTPCASDAPCARRLPIDMRALWTVITSFVFFLVARLLDEARRIDEDNRQII